METISLHSNAICQYIHYSAEEKNGVPIRIETEQIILQPISALDAEVVYELFNSANEEAFEYCSWSKFESVTSAGSWLDERERLWEANEKYEFAIREKKADRVIGTTYIDRKSDGGREGVEFGLWLHPTVWGQGISGHRADVLIHLSFAVFETEFVHVGCLQPNVRSRNAIEKYVSRYNGVFYGSLLTKTNQYSKMESNTLPHYEYEITEDMFTSQMSGLQTTLPGVSYEEIAFQDSK